MKFNEMPYSRPDIEAEKAVVTSLIDELKNAKGFEEADAIFSRWSKIYSRIQTQFSLSYVRHEIDTNDSFYDDEVQYADENLPLIEDSYQELIKTLLQSPFKPQLEMKYGKLMFLNFEINLKTFSPEIVPLLQAENRLTTEYGKLLASAQIPFDGGVYTLSRLAPFKQSADDKVRLAAWKAEGGFYKENSDTLDRLYDELVKVRDEMARKLGYENYIPLGYYRMTRNSYTSGEVARFREAVVKHLVPVADRLYREQAERIGARYPLSHSDMALRFRSGNPKPKGNEQEILDQGKAFYHELSQETAEFIDFMYENELLDVLSRKGKGGGGFCTEFPDYKSPFIFANFNGTADDVEVITHEAGHAFAFYTARDIEPLENKTPTLESCEVHSMSMEFFAWPWAESFFGPDTNKFKYSHLAGAITFIPYGAMVDHFQHSVFEKPEMSPEDRHSEWRRLLKLYMPWVRLDDIPFYGEGRNWQRQSHIYQRPFYYIDYCLAQTVALQFWALMQKDMAGAWRRYFELVKLGGLKTFSELVASAGLASPFGDTALKEVSDAATAWLSLAGNPK